MAQGMQLLVLAILLLAAQSQGQDSACRIRLAIDPAISNFTLQGKNALVPPRGAPLNAPITPGAKQRTAFVGAFFVSFRQANTTCPTTLPALTQGLQSVAWFSNGTEFPYEAALGPSEGIAMYPSQINAITAGQPYRPQNLLWNITAASVNINAATGAVVLSGPASLLRGFLHTEGALTGSRYDDIHSNPGNFSATGTVSVKHHVLTVHLNSFNVTAVATGSLLLGTTTYTSITTLNFVGTMTLQADLSCGVYCGDYGRCHSSGGKSTCRCQCAWARDSSGACTVASGYCDPFLRE